MRSAERDRRYVIALRVVTVSEQDVFLPDPANGPACEVVSIKRSPHRDRRRVASAGGTVGALRHGHSPRPAGREVPKGRWKRCCGRCLQKVQVAVHYEIQERPVYALVIARAAGRLVQPQEVRSRLRRDSAAGARGQGARTGTSNGAPACGMSMRGEQE